MIHEIDLPVTQEADTADLSTADAVEAATLSKMLFLLRDEGILSVCQLAVKTKAMSWPSQFTPAERIAAAVVGHLALHGYLDRNDMDNSMTQIVEHAAAEVVRAVGILGAGGVRGLLDEAGL